MNGAIKAIAPYELSNGRIRQAIRRAVDSPTGA